jgi:ATP diphosphatase
VNVSQAESTPRDPRTGALDQALALVEFLRANCPWDAAQTPRSLRRYLLEESHEVVDAIDAGDDPGLRDELGDLLLNLAFQIVIGEERGAFDRHGVVEGLLEKMRRRHPHLYGHGEAEPWEAIKARERGAQAGEEEGILAELVASSDTLRHAFRVQARVAEVGFDWAEPQGALDKVREEVEEVAAELGAGDEARLEEEIGDLLFSVVNLARLAGVHPPTSLARANAKFTRRFNALEAAARARGIILDEAGPDVLDGLWEDVKRGER